MCQRLKALIQRYEKHFRLEEEAIYPLNVVGDALAYVFSVFS